MGCQLVNWLKRSLSRRLVSPMYCLEQWLHCIMKMTILELQSMSLVIVEVSPVAWNVYDVCPSDVYLQVRQFFSAWV